MAHLVIVSSVTLFEDEPTEDHRKKVDTIQIYLPKVKLLTQQITLPDGGTLLLVMTKMLSIPIPRRRKGITENTEM